MHPSKRSASPTSRALLIWLLVVCLALVLVAFLHGGSSAARRRTARSRTLSMLKRRAKGTRIPVIDFTANRDILAVCPGPTRKETHVPLRSNAGDIGSVGEAIRMESRFERFTSHCSEQYVTTLLRYAANLTIQPPCLEAATLHGDGHVVLRLQVSPSIDTGGAHYAMSISGTHMLKQRQSHAAGRRDSPSHPQTRGALHTGKETQPDKEAPQQSPAFAHMQSPTTGTGQEHAPTELNASFSTQPATHTNWPRAETHAYAQTRAMQTRTQAQANARSHTQTHADLHEPTQTHARRQTTSRCKTQRYTSRPSYSSVSPSFGSSATIFRILLADAGNYSAEVELTHVGYAGHAAVTPTGRCPSMEAMMMIMPTKLHVRFALNSSIFSRGTFAAGAEFVGAHDGIGGYDDDGIGVGADAVGAGGCDFREGAGSVRIGDTPDVMGHPGGGIAVDDGIRGRKLTEEFTPKRCTGGDAIGRWLIHPAPSRAPRVGVAGKADAARNTTASASGDEGASIGARASEAATGNLSSGQGGGASVDAEGQTKAPRIEWTATGCVYQQLDQRGLRACARSWAQLSSAHRVEAPNAIRAAGSAIGAAGAWGNSPEAGAAGIAWATAHTRAAAGGSESGGGSRAAAAAAGGGIDNGDSDGDSNDAGDAYNGGGNDGGAAGEAGVSNHPFSSPVSLRFGGEVDSVRSNLWEAAAESLAGAERQQRDRGDTDGRNASKAGPSVQKRRPFFVLMVGDSLMRGLFFDILEVMLGNVSVADRGWGKRLFQLTRFETNRTDSVLNGQQLDYTVWAESEEGGMRLRMQSGPFWEIERKSMGLVEVRRLLMLDGVEGNTRATGSDEERARRAELRGMEAKTAPRQGGVKEIGRSAKVNGEHASRRGDRPLLSVVADEVRNHTMELARMSRDRIRTWPAPETGVTFDSLTVSKEANSRMDTYAANSSPQRQAPDVIVLGASVAWEVKYGSLTPFLRTLRTVLDVVESAQRRQRRRGQAQTQLVWVTPMAVHKQQAQCSADVDAGFFPSADGTATSNVELGSCSNTEIDAETDNFPFSASGELRSSGQAQPGRERYHHQEPTQRERRYSSALPPLIPPSSSSSPSSLSSSSSSSSSSSPSSPSSSSSSPLSSFPPSSFLSPSSTSTSPTASYTHMTFARSQLYGQLATSLVRDRARRGLLSLAVADAWALSVNAATLSAANHYDDLYLGQNRGVVSRAVATIILNLICP